MSKAYCVRACYSNDDEFGFYESPLFAKREDAERFLAALQAVAGSDPMVGDNDAKQWWWEGDFCPGPNRGYLVKREILDSWDGELKRAKEYLHITYT